MAEFTGSTDADEVRRVPRPTSPAIHALLLHLERFGFDGAPRFLGIDERGRERLTFIAGESYDRSTPEAIPDDALPAIGRLIRRYHDAVTGFSLPDDLHWHAAPERAVPVNTLSATTTCRHGTWSSGTASRSR